ncbi:hypothetical protein Tco_0405655 [Tanacetum coccineum]
MESSPLMNAMAVENVVENESHFSLKIVDQDLSSLEVMDSLLMVEDHLANQGKMKRWRKMDKSSTGSRLIVTGEIVVEWLLEKLVELPMCSPMVERMVDREEKKFLD